MKKIKLRSPIGLRTVKTAVAVLLSMVLADRLGASSSKLIFAMLGALNAMQPTFNESLGSCLTQIVGVILGAIAGWLLALTGLDPILASCIGIIFVISLYNGFRIRYSPGLACIIVVSICLDGEMEPFTYAVTRIWDTAIGLAVGMAINTLIFPYDNSRRIRGLIRSLDQDVLRFLEEVFDGDEVLPDPESLRRKLLDIEAQLEIFSNQKLLLHLRRQKADLERYNLCGEKARELTARLQILSLAGKPGRLNAENRQKLEHCGADIRDLRPLKAPQERDTVTNYHIRQILRLREEILEILEEKKEASRP